MILPKWLSGRGKADGPAASSISARIIERDEVPPLVYAIGDVHGCYDKLCHLEEQIIADAAGSDAVVVMLGDVIDRGPDSSRVIDRLQARPPRGIQRFCLSGNHESAMASFFERPSADDVWLDFGGVETLRSYGIDAGIWRAARMPANKIRYQLDAYVPSEHVAFVSGLPLLIRLGNLVFAHAGLDRRKKLEYQTEHDLLWARPNAEREIAAPNDPHLVVHGHTPVTEAFISPTRINLDTGAYAGGPLSGAKFIDGRFENVITST